jgi:hypothetical protein
MSDACEYLYGGECNCVDGCTVHDVMRDVRDCIHGKECDECRTMRVHIETINWGFLDDDYPDLSYIVNCKMYFQKLENLVNWYNKLETFARALAPNDVKKYIVQEDMDKAFQCIHQMHGEIDYVLCGGRVMAWPSKDEYDKFYRKFWRIAEEFGCTGVHWSNMTFEEACAKEGCNQSRPCECYVCNKE